MSSEAENKVEDEDMIQTLIIPPAPNTTRGVGFHLGYRSKIKNCIAYGAQKFAVIRGVGIDNKFVAINPQHPSKVTVVKFSPNGEWVCSGDVEGSVYIWAHRSFVVKNTAKVGKYVRDVCFDFEGKRVALVGAGKEDKGKVIPWNTNNKLGELTGCGKSFITCDFRPKRPFRLVCGAEDFAVYYYKGTPFVFEAYDKVHKNFVNCVKWNPNGNEYISVSSDKKIYYFNGDTGKKKLEFIDKKNGHKSSMYEVSFNKDGTKFVTCSADKSIKIWNIEKKCVEKTFTFGKDIRDMQVSVVWGDKDIYSVSLNGNINVVDPSKDKPVEVYVGHNSSIDSMDVSISEQYIFSCDASSQVIRTDVITGKTVVYKNKKAHNDKAIRWIVVDCKSKYFYTSGVDDVIVRTEISQKSTTIDNVTLLLGENGCKLEGATKCIVTHKTDNNILYVGTHKGFIYKIVDGKIKDKNEIKYCPSAIDISPDGKELCIADEDTYTIKFYNTNDMKENDKIKCDGHYIIAKYAITRIKYSPNGKYFATLDKNRYIWIWKREDISKPINDVGNGSYRYHSSTPKTIDWSPNGLELVSVGRDGKIVLMKSATDGSYNRIEKEHAFFSGIIGGKFLDNNHIGCVGEDSTIRVYKIVSKDKRLDDKEKISINRKVDDKNKDNNEQKEKEDEVKADE